MTGPARGRVRRGASLTVAALLLVVLSGCFPAGPVPSALESARAQPISVEPKVALVEPRVLAYCPNSPAENFRGYALGGDVVYICRGGESRSTDGFSTYGPWEAAYQVEHPAALLTAYGEPNSRRKRLCPEPPISSDPLIIWLHRDGVTRPYYAPVDGCGLPRPAADAAYLEATRTLLVEFDLGGPIASRKDVNG